MMTVDTRGCGHAVRHYASEPGWQLTKLPVEETGPLRFPPFVGLIQ